MRIIRAATLGLAMLWAVSCQAIHGGQAVVPEITAAAPVDGFSLEDDGKLLAVFEDGAPVLAYRYTRVDPPEGLDERFWRMSYIHPLFGLDGDVLTEDFPSGHRHHRGVFWTWPECTVGGRKMDVWHLDGVRQIFEQWITREADEQSATVAVQNVWVFDDDPTPIVRERISFTVYPADEVGRAIDFHLAFTNVCDEVVTIRGAGDRGYGGFSHRQDSARRPLQFTTADGAVDEDFTEYDTPWADCTSTVEPDGPTSGVAIFQHPSNPGYPHPGWLFRHYGFLGVSYPHIETLTLEPGDGFELRYRMYIHRGDAEFGRVAERFAAYTEQATAAEEE